MVERLIHADRVVRNAALGVVILGLVFLVGVLANLTTTPTAVDIRWSEYSTPVVGTLEEDGLVSRNVDATTGLPVANRNGTITMVTQRCGPLADVGMVSSRTWIVQQPNERFFRIEGDQISVNVPSTDGCVLLSRDFELPERVVNFVRSVPEASITLSFLFDPVDEKLGPILLESEPFHRWEPDRKVILETVHPTIGDTP